jgi:hypothetical protein
MAITDYGRTDPRAYQQRAAAIRVQITSGMLRSGQQVCTLERSTGDARRVVEDADLVLDLGDIVTALVSRPGRGRGASSGR